MVLPRLLRIIADDGGNRAAPYHAVARRGKPLLDAASGRSGNDIREELILEYGDLVLEEELPLLQPLQPDRIGGGGIRHGRDRRIKVSVFLPEPLKLLPDIPLFFVGKDSQKTRRRRGTVSRPTAASRYHAAPKPQNPVVASPRRPLERVSGPPTSEWWTSHDRPCRPAGPVSVHDRFVACWRGMIDQKESFLMTMESHLADLERRHADLDREIAEAMAHPSADDVELAELKKRKLQIKDEINRLRATATVH